LYDPFGRRIAKQHWPASGMEGSGPGRAHEWTDFTWDEWTLIEQTTHGPKLPGPYTLSWDYLGLHAIAQTERLSADASQEDIDCRFFAIVTDLIGTPTELLSEDGSTAWRSRSTAWGLTTYPKGSATNTPLRFPGQYYDPESRLHYNVHRYYDPSVARYLTSDPLGLAAGTDPYAYVGNPFACCDPLGLIRDARGRYARDPSAPPVLHNRDSEYPSGFRQSTHDEMVKNWTDEGIAQGTANPLDAAGNPIPRDQLTWRDSAGQVVPYDQLTYEHLDPVVNHWNTTGYDTTRSVRNDWYNDPSNLEPMTRSQNSSGGARLGQTYRQDTGPNYSCGH
jgi:RHS repeat-associated protein